MNKNGRSSVVLDAIFNEILVDLGGLDGEYLAEDLSLGTLDECIGEVNFVLEVFALVFERVVAIFPCI